MALKDEIKKIRLKNGMTQSDLAKLLGVTQASVSGWERGVSEPEDFRMKQIADLGKTSIEFLGNVNTNDSMFKRVETMIHEIPIGKIFAGDDYLRGRLDTLEEILEELEQKQKQIEKDDTK